MTKTTQGALDLPNLGDLYLPLSDHPMTTTELEQKRQLANNSLNTIHAGITAIGALMVDQPDDTDCDMVGVGHLLQSLGGLALRLQASGANIDAVLVGGDHLAGHS